MDLGLKSKKVLITGASKGIGAAIAKTFLKEQAKTYIVSRGSKHLYETESSLVKEFGKNKVIADECDCTGYASRFRRFWRRETPLYQGGSSEWGNYY